MKEWENKILNNKKKNNSYIICSNGLAFLCVKVKGQFFVKNKDKTKINKIDKLVKL